jgi:translation initiation factor IF-1
MCIVYITHSWGYVYNGHTAVYNIPGVMCTMDIWLCTTFLGLCIQQECCTQPYVHCIHNPRNVVHSHMCIVYITPGMLCTVICALYNSSCYVHNGHMTVHNITGVMYTMNIWLCTTFLGLCVQWTYDCAQHSWGYVHNEHMSTHNPRNVVHSHMFIVHITPGMLYTAICPLYT